MVSLYVGNLSNDIQASDLENLLKPYGQPTKIKIFRDNKGRRRKAYAYVGMAREPAQKAAKSLNNTPFQNRTLNVKVSYSS
jgi:RNA recognition motif-containing protein